MTKFLNDHFAAYLYSVCLKTIKTAGKQTKMDLLPISVATENLL